MGRRWTGGSRRRCGRRKTGVREERMAKVNSGDSFAMGRESIVT